MDSDDDEEVIFKGSQLHEHLINSDYAGPEINYYNSGKKITSQSKTKKSVNLLWKSCVSSWLSKWSFFNKNQEEEFGTSFIRCVTDSFLVSLEDADFLANMFDQRLAHQLEPIRNSNSFGLAALGGVVLSLAALASPTALPLALRLPSLLFVGFGALNALNWKMYDWKRKRLDHLLTEFTTTLKSLHSLCSCMNKSMQFIQEMELIDRGFTLPNLVTHLSLKSLRTSSPHSALLCLPLRRELVQVSVCLHRLCLTHTLHIRERLPLSGAVDNASHYLACCGCPPPSAADTVTENSADDQTAVITLQTIRASMRQCHLQLSEMLRRLALAFLVPVGDEHLNIIRQLNVQMQSQSSELGQRITTAYDYFTAWKVRETSSSTAAAPPLTHDGSLELALHSLDGHLMAVNLLMEQSRKEDSIIINDLRVQLSHELKSIATCWELVELELDKSKGPLAAAPSRPFIPLSSRTVEKNDPVPLYGAWKPQVEDLEILEADLMHEPSIGDGDMDDDLFALRETREERLARKRLMAAQSKLLYSELQVVLQSKAAEWKEREDKVMQRLGITPPPPPVTSEPLAAMTYTEPVGVKFIPFNLQSSLAAQVRALASQRTVGQQEDVIGDDSSSSDGESSEGQSSHEVEGENNWLDDVHREGARE